MQFLELKSILESLGMKIFSINDIAKITNKSKDYLKVYLQNHIKKGNLEVLKKGNYTFYNLTKYELSSMYSNSYISLYSALEYYNLTTQLYTQLDLISLKQIKKIKIDNTIIEFHKISNNKFFGFNKEKYRNGNIFIADYEKLIIDCILFFVSINEINEAIIKIKEKLNIEKIIIYLNKINNNILNKRLGYLLDINGIDIFNKIKIMKNYEKLNQKLKKNGMKNKKWKLIINEEFENGNQ